MRKEATLKQWSVLYETATRIKEQKPWEKFWDMDLIGIRNGAEEDTVFFSILGRGGNCYGIAVYEGYEGLNSFLMLTMQEKMNLSCEYAMACQKNLTCYWGNREELTEKQRKIIKELGYKYRGKNQWLYFMSFEPGYAPYNFDAEEVARMSEHLQDLELALRCYDEIKEPIAFEESKMFLLTYGEKKKTWEFGAAPIPFTTFQVENLILEDAELLEELARVPSCSMILEAEVFPVGVNVTDKKYLRPGNPMMSALCETASGMILKYGMSSPDDDPMMLLADELIDFIFRAGAPKEIRVSNVIVEAALEQICEVCKIKLRRVRRLRNIEEFRRGMRRFIGR